MSEFTIPWQSLVDAAPDGLFVVDPGGAVCYANAAALSLLGLPAPGGMLADEWLAGLDDSSRQQALKTIADVGQVRLSLPEAQPAFLLLQTEALEGGGVVGRVRRDYEVEASEIIAILVHELRLPMTSIMGYARMLATIGVESLNEMQRQFIDTIDRNVKRLDRDLSAVQDMTRVDRRKLKLNVMPQSVAEVAAQALAGLEPLIEEKGHHISLDLPADLPPVQADAERLEQILHILLDNAVKYTPTGGEITLQGSVVDGTVQIDVVDNGPGIPVTEQAQIFSKFFRGEAEHIRAHPGLGLNLYIARGLVEMQGGRLWFESVEGQGSTFSLTLSG